MAMDAGEVERLIKAKLPDAKVTIRDLVGDADHLSARVYVKGEFVGGCDIVREMFQSGDLQELLNQKGVHDDKYPTPA
jgi:acid stress-induced BolA-like protein IbaG/YrbA